MARYILALDQGTSSSRAVLFDEEGAPVATEQREFAQLYPRDGWVEHDPEAIWSSQLQAAQDVLQKSGVSAEQVAAVGITNQRETTVVWERETGRPIANAIVWQCRRTAEQCDELRRQGLEPLIRERTGLLLDAYFSATKIRWLLDHVPDAQRRAEAGELAFGTIDSWLIYRLTGGRVHATDATNASRTMLFHLREGRWDDELLRRFGIPAAMLPEVVDSSGVLGECDPSLLGAALPIAGVAGDQQAALFGQACFRAGEAKNTYGTGSFLLLHTGETPPPADKLLATVASRLDGRLQYALEGSIFVTGAAVQWLRDGLRFFDNAADVEALAASVDSSDGVYLVPAFVGLGAPHWDPYARGAILGLTRGSTQAHIARATLEAIAFQTRDVLEAMESETGARLPTLRADGGASRNDLLMQIQADLLGRPVVRSAVAETTALGAAYLAGLGVGLWPGLDDLAQRWRSDRTFEPRLSAEQRDEQYAGWKRALERAQGWLPSA
ncbi:MAG: glycerol kinase GlpK [Chloroflexi bacterium]|nr:glycerol kinase GlpK [Chloroflexota bacterium]